MYAIKSKYTNTSNVKYMVSRCVKGTPCSKIVLGGKKCKNVAWPYLKAI